MTVCLNNPVHMVKFAATPINDLNTKNYPSPEIEGPRPRALIRSVADVGPTT